MTPHKCPVCGGLGTLPSQMPNTANRCHVCEGKGIVWGPPTPAPQSPPLPATPMPGHQPGCPCNGPWWGIIPPVCTCCHSWTTPTIVLCRRPR